MYSLKFKSSVQKDLRKIGQETAKRVMVEIRGKLLLNPAIGTPLKGQEGVIWKYRVGNYRVLYTFNDNESELFLLVIRIGHRKDVYRNLPKT